MTTRFKISLAAGLAVVDVGHGGADADRAASAKQRRAAQDHRNSAWGRLRVVRAGRACGAAARWASDQVSASSI